MRTAVYVLEPTTITLQPSCEEDVTARLVPYRREPPSMRANGTFELARGVYMIESQQEVRVSGKHVQVEIAFNSKDPFPEAPPDLVALEEGATLATLQQFFYIIEKEYGIEKALDVK